MDRPNLRGRVPDAITTRVPGGTSETGEAATDRPSEDGGDEAGAASRSRGLTTALTLAGLGLAALGVVLRYVLDRRDDAGDDEGEEDLDFESTTVDRSARGTVEIVGDEVEGAATADRAPADSSAAATADSVDADEDDAEPDASSDFETEDEAEGTETAEETALSDVRVDTFGVDRRDDETDADPVGGGEDDGHEGPPRIAPLVGIVALVGMRLLVERLGKNGADAYPAADQL